MKSLCVWLYLRLHVEEVAYGYVGVGLAVPVAFGEELFLGPGHVDPVGRGVSLVIHGCVRGGVPVVNELGLETSGSKLVSTLDHNHSISRSLDHSITITRSRSRPSVKLPWKPLMTDEYKVT